MVGASLVGFRYVFCLWFWLDVGQGAIGVLHGDVSKTVCLLRLRCLGGGSMEGPGGIVEVKCELGSEGSERIRGDVVDEAKSTTVGHKL